MIMDERSLSSSETISLSLRGLIVTLKLNNSPVYQKAL